MLCAPGTGPPIKLSAMAGAIRNGMPTVVLLVR